VKIAVSGKGGVGKTTLSSGLARHFASTGRRVFAIDADPDANLPEAVGATPEQAAACTPLSGMDDLIEERTGARPGVSGGTFKLNPRVDDVPEMCGIDVHGVGVMRMGAVDFGGGGCMCAESTFLRALLGHLLVERDDVVILDMEAGLEHLGRGTAESVDAFVVVVEPGARSLQTARSVKALAADLGVHVVVAVGNKVRSPEDEEYLRENLEGVPLVAVLPESEEVRNAERAGRAVYDASPAFARALARVAESLEELVMEGSEKGT
jgi:CO dehydrogenase maturation factor